MGRLLLSVISSLLVLHPDSHYQSAQSNNLHELSEPVRLECLKGLGPAHRSPPVSIPVTTLVNHVGTEDANSHQAEEGDAAIRNAPNHDSDHRDDSNFVGGSQFLKGIAPVIEPDRVSQGDSRAESETTRIEPVHSQILPVKYWGNAFSLKFHRPSCPFAQVMSAHNVIFFNFRKQAIESGQIPCRYCLPPSWTSVRAVILHAPQASDAVASPISRSENMPQDSLPVPKTPVFTSEIRVRH